MSTDAVYPARYWHWIDDGRMQCDLCPRDCRLHDGQRGACFVRMRQGDRMILTTYGRSSGFCIDPIEKKPLNHFYPGSSVLSFGTAGCNLACKFCQNWDISKSRDMDRLMDQASPEVIALEAVKYQCKSVAFTYNDPVIFAEYAMDAANVDLKAFSDDFYFQLTGSHLQPVLDTLRYLKHETQVWFEITTLLIPGHNDSDAEISALSRWVADELGPEVPLHFSAFHPDYKMPHVPATPLATLTRARHLARSAGLHHVYTGNVHHAEGDTTFCPHCKAVLIERDWYRIDRYRLDARGQCPDCGTPLAGRFEHTAGKFGRKRIPVVIGA